MRRGVLFYVEMVLDLIYKFEIKEMKLSLRLISNISNEYRVKYINNHEFIKKCLKTPFNFLVVNYFPLETYSWFNYMEGAFI